MLVTRGLGRPGSLLVSGGLGRGVFVPVAWLPDTAPFEITFTDPVAFLFTDLSSDRFEDRFALLACDRTPVAFEDFVLIARDRDTLTFDTTLTTFSEELT